MDSDLLTCHQIHQNWSQTESFRWDQWPNEAPYYFQDVHNPKQMDPIHEDLSDEQKVSFVNLGLLEYLVIVNTSIHLYIPMA